MEKSPLFKSFENFYSLSPEPLFFGKEKVLTPKENLGCSYKVVVLRRFFGFSRKRCAKKENLFSTYSEVNAALVQVFWL